MPVRAPVYVLSAIPCFVRIRFFCPKTRSAGRKPPQWRARFVNQLADQEAVNEVYVATGKQLRPNRNGNLYLQFELFDRTGRITARLWNAGDAVYQSFENGDYVRVEGTSQLFQGAMQLIATKLTKVEPDEVNSEDFVMLPSVAVDKLTARIRELLQTVSDPGLSTLAECYLMDEPLMEKVCIAPAGLKTHHAYPGGLLEHVVTLMDVASRIAPCYPMIDRDLLIVGAFVHDMSKVEELDYDREIGYTDEGQLIGHLVMGVRVLEDKAEEAAKLGGEPVDPEKLLRLKHIVISHHGQYDYGSPKLPMTLEAVALAFLDNLDAKISQFYQHIQDDPNHQSSWTVYNPNLQRKLFKGKPGSAS